MIASNVDSASARSKPSEESSVRVSPITAPKRCRSSVREEKYPVWLLSVLSSQGRGFFLSPPTAYFFASSIVIEYGVSFRKAATRTRPPVARLSMTISARSTVPRNPSGTSMLIHCVSTDVIFLRLTFQCTKSDRLSALSLLLSRSPFVSTSYPPARSDLGGTYCYAFFILEYTSALSLNAASPSTGGSSHPQYEYSADANSRILFVHFVAKSVPLSASTESIKKSEPSS